MGEQLVKLAEDKQSMQNFVRHLFKDVRALEYMLRNDWFETDTIRIGAEQEMCLVDLDTYKPANIGPEVLAKLSKYPWADAELARFNLETNLTPREFKGTCLSQMEAENREHQRIIREQARKMGAGVVLTGILPTLRKFDLDMSNLTPRPRYFALMEAINRQLIGNAYELRLSGIDELLVKHDSPLLEACNTSFQVHLQVTPATFVQMYNIAQTLAAPVLAIAANSPIVFGKRLWHETRIALFQQALDVRTTHDHLRERSPRVSFGTGWLDKSLMEIYKEDIARFRVLLESDIEEDSMEQVLANKVPRLKALLVHNSTVYRWNRPCYGISDNGQPHLRIENRVLPAGPTVVDEMANAAFWLGAMVGMAEQYPDIREEISWEDVRDNFGKAAKFGVDTNFTWFKDKKINACDLITKELLPLARAGLKSKNIATADIDKYLGIIEERAKAHMNGARWQLRAFTKLKKEVNRDEAVSILTAYMLDQQNEGKPVHTWEMPKQTDLKEYRPANLTVEEFMETDLFTVHEDDLIEMVAQLMDWRKIRHMPVEDTKGHLIGLITARSMLRYFTNGQMVKGEHVVSANEIMIANPLTINPKATIIEAMRIMRENKVGCLPVVVANNELIGIITEMDFVRISGRLIERLGEQKEEEETKAKKAKKK
ncbi:MAG: CBS domain-containing protein [Bacteroidetes bacterium]|nr:MAG: CBS domain-containing protein [Bacteroidota bacterium]PTM11144.1 MAG: CBS domain-containing protein [Bacteroidota bacterium]